jgi:hypothetical protein
MPPDVRSTAELFVTVKVTGRVMPGSVMMHPDTLLGCKERVKTVTEFGSIAPAAAGADVPCGWLQPLTKVAAISTSVLIFLIRFRLSSDRALL